MDTSAPSTVKKQPQEPAVSLLWPAAVLGFTLGFLVGVSQTPAVGPFLSGFLGLIGGGVLAMMAGVHSEVRLSPEQIRLFRRGLICFCVVTLISVFIGSVVRACIVAAAGSPFPVAKKYGDKVDPATMAKLALLDRRLEANGVDCETKEKVIATLVSKHGELDYSLRHLEDCVSDMQRKLYRINKLLVMLNSNREYLLAADASKWKPLEKPGGPFAGSHPDQADIDDSSPNGLIKLVEELKPQAGLAQIDMEWVTVTEWLGSFVPTQRRELDRLLEVSRITPSERPPTEQPIPCSSLRFEFPP